MEITGVGEAAQAVEASARVAEVAVNGGTKVFELSVKGISTVIKIIAKTAKWTEEMIAKLARAHLAKMNSHDLVPGEMDLSELLSAAAEKGEKTHIIQIDEELIPLFEKFVSDNQLSYSYLFDLNEKDNCKEVMITEGESQMFFAFVHENPELSRVISSEDYINQATPAGWQRVTDTLERAAKEQGKEISKGVDAGEMDLSSFLKAKGDSYAACYQISDYASFSKYAADNGISYTVFSFADGSAACIVPSEAYGDMNRYITETGDGAYCQVSEFLNAYPDMEVPGELKALAARGSGVPLTEKQEFYTIDSDQIIDVNDHSVKFAVKTETGTEMAAILPREELLKTDEPDRYYIKVSGDDVYMLYEDTGKFTHTDETGQTKTVPQTASAWMTGDTLCQYAKTKSDEIIKEKGQEQVVQSKFVNSKDVGRQEAPTAKPTVFSGQKAEKIGAEVIKEQKGASISDAKKTASNALPKPDAAKIKRAR